MEHDPVLPGLLPGGKLAMNEAQMAQWGEKFGSLIDPPLVVAIVGDLGSGKTTLTRAICRGYGVKDDVTSPTFNLVHEYQGRKSKVFHLDLYRMNSPRELDALGWDDMLHENALVIVEWADRAPGLMPSPHVPIDLSHLPDQPDRRALYAGGHT